MAQYPYPVTNPFQARTVTEPDFDPDLFTDNLYVDFDQVRGEDFINDIYFTLNIDQATKQLVDVTDEYVKIIFSGHRGCGKTTELKRLHNELNHPDRYFSIFLSIEEEMEISSFQPEDFFVWFILKLVEAVKYADIPVGMNGLNELAKLFFSDKTVEKELKENFQTELSLETGGGFSIFDWIKFKAAAKGIFAGSNQTSTKIREEIKRNTLDIITKINFALVDIREALKQNGKGQDILFIVDGSEKLKFEMYDYLFVQNSNLLKSLSVNLVAAVPIHAYYLIDRSPVNFTNQVIMPMIKLGEPDSHANRCFKEVISRRINVGTFFDEGVLDECVRCSGGCMRQLLIIVNSVIKKALGKKASMETAQTAIHELGRKMYELLDSQHLEALQKPTRQLGDEKVREMLFQLILLKYNGHTKLNPLLIPFVTIPHD